MDYIYNGNIYNMPQLTTSEQRQFNLIYKQNLHCY
jgi:hypothetical protein